jgi:hypothetical protein
VSNRESGSRYQEKETLVQSNKIMPGTLVSQLQAHSQLRASKEQLPFKNGAPNTEKGSSPWSPITVTGFMYDEKLG